MGVPPYVVLPDAVLTTIVARRPASRPELARIPGLGPRALAKFGDTILAHLQPVSANRSPHHLPARTMD